MSRKEYAYTTGTLSGTPVTVNYSYSTSTWGDLLTKFDGKTVSSDAIGNITSISGYRTYTWKHGRQLASSSGVGGNWTYSYNADGMRYKRTSGNAAYTYYYNGDLLRYVDYDSNTTDSSAAAKLYFVLDATGKPIEVSYRPEGSTETTFYYFIHNLQGDVVALVDSVYGNKVVEYTYDAWGNVLTTTGSMATTLGKLNPFRYRSYVYDEESKLYYLQSRYYDPEMGRFINADAFTTTGQGLLGNNTFAYCQNTPANSLDKTGFYLKYTDPYRAPVFINLGGNATGVSNGTSSGGGGPIPVAGLTVQEIVKTVSTICDITDGFNGLSHAAEYGVKGYSELKREIAGTGLHAHHDIEQRFLKGFGIDTSTSLSIALTPAEHQKFTNQWRRFFPYGKTDYKSLSRTEVWDAAQIIYRDYPELLEAAHDILF